MARRITIYFSVFGLVIFAVTAVLYTMSSQKHFTRATAQLIRNQVIQIEGSSVPDFILHRVGGPMPGLINLTRMLANFSASFYSVSDIDLYVHSTENGQWHQLYFDESGALRKRESADASLAKLKFHDPSKIPRNPYSPWPGTSGPRRAGRKRSSPGRFPPFFAARTPCRCLSISPEGRISINMLSG
jgi:hypothetical protein